MKPGILYQSEGRVWPYDYCKNVVYGYNNRYGLIVSRKCGGPRDTVGSEKGLYEVMPVGLGLKASEVKSLPCNLVQALFEALSGEEQALVCELPEALDKPRHDPCYGLIFILSQEETERLAEQVARLPERAATHVVKEPSINPYYTARQKLEEIWRKLEENGDL